MSFKYVNIVPDSCRIRIIQNSFEKTGSTVVVNLLHGMFCPNCPYHGSGPNRKVLPHLVNKGHDMNYSAFQNAFGKQYELYFISTERHRKVKKESGSRILVIPYDKILETAEYSLRNIVDYFYEQCESFLPRELFIKSEDEMKSSVYKRVDDMNKRYEEIKHQAFHSPHDKFYGIHGSHRSSNYFSKHKK
jgi:hypothetical protein